MAEKIEKGTKLKATYYTSVYKFNLSGFRSEKVEATLVALSPGKAKVVKASMAKAGSKRQEYNVSRAEYEEIGKTKIISKLSNVKIMG